MSNIIPLNASNISSCDDAESTASLDRIGPGFIEEAGYRLGFLQRSSSLEPHNVVHIDSIVRAELYAIVSL